RPARHVHRRRRLGRVHRPGEARALPGPRSIDQPRRAPLLSPAHRAGWRGRRTAAGRTHDPEETRVSSAFDDVLSANAVYAQSFRLSGLEPVAARGLGLVTCMDSRIEPLTMLGLRPGDAKILRNAGARVTDDTLRTLVLAVYLLGVERVLIMPHTKCKMASVSGDDEVHDLIRDQYGVDARSRMLAVYPPGLERVLGMPRTKCKMASVSGGDEVHDQIRDQYGVDTRSLELHTDNDHLGALRHDLERVRHHALLPDGLPVAGALYDVDTGKLEIVDE